MVSVIIVLVLFLKLTQKVQGQHRTIDNIQSLGDTELSSLKPSAQSASKQGKGNFDEYNEVVSPTSTAGPYETIPARQPGEPERIYSKI